jgi:hypothetical protein
MQYMYNMVTLTHLSHTILKDSVKQFFRNLDVPPYQPDWREFILPVLRAAMGQVEAAGRDLRNTAPKNLRSIISLNIWGLSVGRSMGER